MKKILIVDDEKDIRFILNEILTESGYSVSTLGTIKEAENYISQNVFDLALLDVLLDEKSRDGLYLLNLIKNKNKNLPAPVQQTDYSGASKSECDAVAQI